LQAYLISILVGLDQTQNNADRSQSNHPFPGFFGILDAGTVGLSERTMIRRGDDNAPDIIRDNMPEFGHVTWRPAYPGVCPQGKPDFYAGRPIAFAD
jgi:hypothetical protein